MKKSKNNDAMGCLSHAKWRCEYQDVDIIEENACSDHIHMQVKISHKLIVSKFMDI